MATTKSVLLAKKQQQTTGVQNIQSAEGAVYLRVGSKKIKLNKINTHTNVKKISHERQKYLDEGGIALKNVDAVDKCW